MKKITLLLLFISTITFAQEAPKQEDTAGDDVKLEVYIGGGAIFNPDYNINSYLTAAGVKRISDVSPAFNFGWKTSFKNGFSFDIGAAALSSKNKRKDGSQLVQATATFKMQYDLIKRQEYAFSAGINFSYVGSDLSVYDAGTIIDAHDITPSHNSGYLRLRNSSYFLGPVVAFRLKDGVKTFLTLTAGYDFAVSNTRWKSDYASVANPVRENGNRFFVNLTLPFLTKWTN